MRSLALASEDDAREAIEALLADLVRVRKSREDAERRIRAFSLMLDGIVTMFPALRAELPDDFEPPAPRSRQRREPR